LPDFSNVTVPHIIEKIFKDNGFTDFKNALTGTYPPRGYCVQYRESDFNFVSRLMEYEGIFYYFKHEKDKHILVLADSVSAYQEIAHCKTVPFLLSGIPAGQKKYQHIFEWYTLHTVQSERYVLNDYDFEKPKNKLITHEKEADNNNIKPEHFDYPGNYAEKSAGKNYADIRMDELQSDYEVIQGRGHVLGLTTGMVFTLEKHYLASENTRHIVIADRFCIDLDATLAGDIFYEHNFKAIHATQQFRPQRITPVPFVQGPQTAVVVGKQGEDIWTDKYGRIKVQFHWDRDGKKDESSSCWIRVSQPIAGNNWGYFSLPRIGQEVVVSFLEGNPDRPLVTGSVYNADQMPPYALPANQTQSGFKSRSSKEGTGENFNELRFEDKKGSEEVYLHAEKDFNCVIENNETRKIGLDKKSKGNQTLEIQNDRTVGLNQGNDTLTVKKGNHAINVNMGKSTIEAMQSIELKVGKSSIKLDQKGITINGIMVVVEADVKLDAKGKMTTVNGDGVLILKGALTMIN
jgi:type VI secretion system secreted protein VgrG